MRFLVQLDVGFASPKFLQALKGSYCCGCSQLTLSCHVAFTVCWDSTESGDVSRVSLVPTSFVLFTLSGMAWTKYQLFLAGLMLITGSINTLSAK